MGKTEAGLLTALLPNIKVIAFDKNQGVSAIFSLWRQLKTEHFDALLHMQTAMRASVLSVGIKAKYRLGFDKKRASDLQTWFTNIKVPSPASLHVLDGFMAFAHALGVPNAAPQWDLTLPADIEQWAKAQLSAKPNVVIAPATSKAYKNWTVAGYVAVIEHLLRFGCNPILVGGPSASEVELGAQICANLQQNVTNLIGKTSLLQLLGLIEQAKLVIAPDSGPAHLANAVNTPVIGLYAHHNPERTGPYNWRHYVVSVYQACVQAETGKAPQQLAWRTRVKDPQAMTKITAAEVIAKIDEVIKKEGILS